MILIDKIIGDHTGALPIDCAIFISRIFDHQPTNFSALSMGTVHITVLPLTKGCMVMTRAMEENANSFRSTSQTLPTSMEKKIQALKVSIQELTC